MSFARIAEVNSDRECCEGYVGSFVRIAEGSSDVRVIVFEGVSRSVGEWARLLGIPVGTIYRRLQVGVCDPALLLFRGKLPSPHDLVLTFGGVSLPLVVWAGRIGVSRQALCGRLKKYPLEVALLSRLPRRCGRKGRLVVFGGLSLSVREWAVRLGVSRQALYVRLRKYSVDVALRFG